MGPPFAFKLPREGCESALCSSTGLPLLRPLLPARLRQGMGWGQHPSWNGLPLPS